MDPLTPEQRRKNMQAIRSKDTSIEIILRKALWAKGLRYRKNYKYLPGKPDIVFTKQKIVIFCDSEFWHGYQWEAKKQKISANSDYWITKIENNMRRDEENNRQLSENGWLVLRFWGKEIKRNTDACVEIICQSIKNRSQQIGC